MHNDDLPFVTGPGDLAICAECVQLAAVVMSTTRDDSDANATALAECGALLAKALDSSDYDVVSTNLAEPGTIEYFVMTSAGTPLYVTVTDPAHHEPKQ